MRIFKVGVGGLGREMRIRPLVFLVWFATKLSSFRGGRRRRIEDHHHLQEEGGGGGGGDQVELERKVGSLSSSRRVMETVDEEVEEYNYKEVVLPTLIPAIPQSHLEHATGERRRGRYFLVAVDHGPNSRYALHWALVHLCRLPDTLHLVHAVSSVHNELIYDKSRQLMENLAVEAFQMAMVISTAWIVEGDAGKAVCREAARLKPAAVIMGTRGRGIIQSVLQGSVSEYCFHNCKVAPVIIVPGKDAGEQSLI